MKKCVITVVGKDKVGIIAGVCNYLADTNINILDINQTIVDGFFNMVTIVDVSNSTKQIAEISDELTVLGEKIGVIIHLQRAEIFEKMHRL
ncbi:MAG: ACT domain-containing protein [Suipraeoptans sp.]